jgi:hypothetical protein
LDSEPTVTREERVPLSMQEPAKNRRPPAVVPGRSALAQRAALDSVVGGALAGFCVVLGAAGLGVPWLAVPGLLFTAGVAWSRHRARLQEVERTAAREAELSIYRVAERLQRTDREKSWSGKHSTPLARPWGSSAGRSSRIRKVADRTRCSP